MTETQEETVRRLPELKERHLPGDCREAVHTLLKGTYGYEQFRDLEVYDDLFKGKETLHVSQGQLIESVIVEAEKARNGETDVDNILLTAPTGAGKSLLFQLPGIYLGNEYGLLTIVVSPLKALIVDQVEGLQDLGYTRVAYASSDLSPEQKNEVYRQVREGEVDLFYLSPELLLSYDIKHFAGERRIGLVVVDEAHTVTTWGKEFRVDYWFLGRYLQGLKKNLGYAFPLFALTATAVWNPKGGNDMVFETIRSLQMEPCVLYAGTVKRRNIGFDIRQMEIEEGETYDKAKQRVVAGRVDDFLDGYKTILYYPFAGGIDMRLKTWVQPADWRLVASYYGKKDKEQKAAIVQEFKEGEKRMIVATKAFGMGVDISDIDRVYHVAPSSTFVDYIQEIGRAARDTDIHGVSATDYHERDFYYMKRLHQTGNIAQEQLELILKKLMEVYRMKGEKKEILVSEIPVVVTIATELRTAKDSSTYETLSIEAVGDEQKVYEQGKEYYDKLKAVHNLVQDARKVKNTILLVGEISDIYVNSFQKMLADPHFRYEELTAISNGYTVLLKESADMLLELKDVVNINGLSMTDAERMDIINYVHDRVKRHRDLVAYYTRKNISVSYLRAKKAGDTDRVMALYGKADERYW